MKGSGYSSIQGMKIMFPPDICMFQWYSFLLGKELDFDGDFFFMLELFLICIEVLHPWW